MTTSVDFDLHGVVGIRLLDATSGDVAAVKRQLGLSQTRLERAPDITLRFVDRIEDGSRLRYLGIDDVAFTDEAFYVLRSRHKSRVKVQIPFQTIGEACEIVCERGLPAVPLLIPILNLTALNKGILALHASAFNFLDQGLVALGWAKGGKTETLLAFMLQGAEYVGDEWVYFTEDGDRMFGIPEPIRLWDWHIEDLPEIRARLNRRERAKLSGLRTLVRFVETTSSLAGKSLAGFSRRVVQLLRRQMNVLVPPERLFGTSACALQGRPDAFFFVASHDSPEVIVEQSDPKQIARRMVFSLEEERHDLYSAYLKFRFAFPHRRNLLIEGSAALQREALERVLAAKPVFSVFHPFPVQIAALYEAVAPYCHMHTSDLEV